MQNKVTFPFPDCSRKTEAGGELMDVEVMQVERKMGRIVQ
jgi:hypothetical protein